MTLERNRSLWLILDPTMCWGGGGGGLCSVSAFGESCRGGEETDGLEKCLEQLSDLTRYILSHQAV